MLWTRLGVKQAPYRIMLDAHSYRANRAAMVNWITLVNTNSHASVILKSDNNDLVCPLCKFKLVKRQSQGSQIKEDNMGWASSMHIT
jgi:hypothetical protein